MSGPNEGKPDHYYEISKVGNRTLLELRVREDSNSSEIPQKVIKPDLAALEKARLAAVRSEQLTKIPPLEPPKIEKPRKIEPITPWSTALKLGGEPLPAVREKPDQEITSALKKLKLAARSIGRIFGDGVDKIARKSIEKGYSPKKVFVLGAFCLFAIFSFFLILMSGSSVSDSPSQGVVAIDEIDSQPEFVVKTEENSGPATGSEDRDPNMKASSPTVTNTVSDGDQKELVDQNSKAPDVFDPKAEILKPSEAEILSSLPNEVVAEMEAFRQSQGDEDYHKLLNEIGEKIAQNRLFK